MLRTRELESHGISRVYLRRLVDSGQLERIGHGLYSLAGADLGEEGSLAQAAKGSARPNLPFIGGSAPWAHDPESFEVWIAVGQKARRPAVSYPPPRIIHLASVVRHK